MRGDAERLADIVEAIERIQRHAERGRAAFEADELLQTWVIHNVQVIGEAAGGLSAALTDSNPKVPWRAITGIRHVLVHDYFVVDLEKVWAVVEEDLPALRRQVEAILERLGN